jgi:hypothetical protein
MCGHPSSSMAFKSSESCKILNHNNDNVNKNQKKNCTRKIMPILCMPQAQYGENYEHWSCCKKCASRLDVKME